MNNLSLVKKDNWVDTINSCINTRSKNTQIAYKNDLIQFVEIMGIDLLIATEKDYLKFFKELENRGYSYSSIARKITTLSVYLDYLVLVKQLTTNPIANIRRVTRLYRAMSKMPAVEINKEDVNRVIVKSGRHISIIIESFVNTGLRVSELIGIKKTDIKVNIPARKGARNGKKGIC